MREIFPSGNNPIRSGHCGWGFDVSVLEEFSLVFAIGPCNTSFGHGNVSNECVVPGAGHDPGSAIPARIAGDIKTPNRCLTNIDCSDFGNRTLVCNLVKDSGNDSPFALVG